jgi:hypothetical protein
MGKNLPRRFSEANPGETPIIKISLISIAKDAQSIRVHVLTRTMNNSPLITHTEVTIEEGESFQVNFTPAAPTKQAMLPLSLKLPVSVDEMREGFLPLIPEGDWRGRLN